VRRASRLAAALVVGLVLAVFILGGSMIGMPGRSFQGVLPPLTPLEEGAAQELRRDVEALANQIGERNLQRFPARLKAAEKYLDSQLEKAGYRVEREAFSVAGQTCHNLIASASSASGESGIVVVGAHYDTVPGSPGANDNGSGLAALLYLARSLAVARLGKSVRFVAFCNEEPPYFRTDGMGSLVHARRSREHGDHIVAMISLETMGFFSDEDGSQKYPFPLSLFYPSRGNFMAFVSNVKHRGLLKQVLREFRRNTQFPSEGGALPGSLPGIGWSDHWAFWRQGYPALMVTDTAPFRYPWYHTSQDTPDKLDYERLARVVVGLERVVRFLAQ
jgi:hypothetical protein